MTFKIFNFILTVGVLTITYASKLPEEELNTPELIRYFGYPVEIHNVETQDGYILEIHRIPNGKPGVDPLLKKPNVKRPVILLQHGLLCSSSNWVTNFPRQSLGFMLADSGFDVWLGNVRGNTYSRKHKKYSTKSSAFWKFSFDEMAKYDLPAMVDYALNKTGEAKLFYAGHSQGTMMGFAGFSENAKLRNKIRTFFALAPVASLKHTTSPVGLLSYFEELFKFTFSLFNIKEFLPSTRMLKYIAKNGCPFDESLCDNVLFLIAGFDKKNLNATRTPVYYSHTPAGTSVQNMLHFSQLIQDDDGLFTKYDYGLFRNVLNYGSPTPPVYNLTNMKVPTVLFTGSKDSLADPKDVAWLRKQLPHVRKYIEIPEYNHLDFIWGLSARDKVYKKIIEMAWKYTQS